MRMGKSQLGKYGVPSDVTYLLYKDCIECFQCKLQGGQDKTFKDPQNALDHIYKHIRMGHAVKRGEIARLKRYGLQRGIKLRVEQPYWCRRED